MTTARYDSPLGPLTLVGHGGRLSEVRFGKAPEHEDGFEEAIRQLDEYFAGARTSFELELDLAGTPFQRAVWKRLLEIPYGTTITYTRLAELVERPGCARAAGAAVGRTPVPIVVPCHRVVGSDGSLTGYRGGLPRKAALQDLERRGSASLRLPEGDLGAGRSGQDAAPAGRSLARVQHHRGP
jgi:methylated-DNA-[protein]-cysteine S-methyltransferase